MKKMDIIVQILFIVILIGLSVFWGCHYDPMVTVLGIVIAFASGVATFYQYKKIGELEEKQDEKFHINKQQ